LRRSYGRNEGPLGNEEMAKIFRQVNFLLCLALEKPNAHCVFWGQKAPLRSSRFKAFFGKSLF